MVEITDFGKNSKVWTFVKRYEFDLMVIFDQWPKLHLGLDVRPEIPILKGLYCLLTSKNIEIVLQFPHNWEFEKDVSAFQLKLY